ncbi:MAG: PPOX class F420-dependent oxidoreductase [Thermomicrobiales bacterium]|nr:PPOX class F420-dependent oxidoreductase [Chloroflexia bacterium]
MELRSDVRAFLDEPRFGVLATINGDGSPQQTVMWYQFRGDTVMMNTARGRKKDRNLLRDGRASLCIEEGYRYVTLAGDITLYEDQVIAQADIAALARRYHDPEEAERMIQTAFQSQERVSLILNISRVEMHGFDGEE